MSETLLPRNKDYYERLATYVTESFGVNGVAAEETLAEIRADLLQAQANGVGAADYFGQDPEAIAAQLVANLPHRTWRGWLVVGLCAWGLSFLLLSWMLVAQGVRALPLGTCATLAVILPLGILGANAWHRRRIFKRKKVRDSGVVVAVVVQLVVMPLLDVFPRFGRVTVPSAVIVGVGLGLAALFVGLGIWLGLRLLLVDGLLSVFATLFAWPALDRLGLLPGWWGRLMLLGLFVGLGLLIFVGERVWPAKWQAGAK